MKTNELLIPAQHHTHSHPDSIYDGDPASEWDTLIRARLLLLMGYATFIVEIETGLTSKRIRKIRSDLIDEGVSCSSPRSLKRSSSKSLITSRVEQQRASILMSLYTSLHAGYSEQTDPLLLGTAYGLFLGAMQGIGISHVENESEEEDSAGAAPSLITINQAWSLAAELRATEGAMVECTQCGTGFYEAIHQHYLGDHPCPWCG